MLEKFGIERFKLSVNRHYGMSDVIRHSHGEWKGITDFLGTSSQEHLMATTEHPMTETESFLFDTNDDVHIYRNYVCMLWDICLRLDKDGLCDLVSEPEFGSPIYISYQGRRITQDLAKSVLDAIAVRERLPALASGSSLIAEIGPGYGRLAHVLAQTSNCRYAFFDIPPALYVAQSYFEHLYPGQVAPFRRYRSHGELAQAIEGKRFMFFTANQLALFPDQSFDAMINIDSFGEMEPETVRTYVAHMSRQTRAGGGLYMRNIGTGSMFKGRVWEVAGAEDYTPKGNGLDETWTAEPARNWPMDPRYVERVFVRER